MKKYRINSLNILWSSIRKSLIYIKKGEIFIENIFKNTENNYKKIKAMKELKKVLFQMKDKEKILKLKQILCEIRDKKR